MPIIVTGDSVGIVWFKWCGLAWLEPRVSFGSMEGLWSMCVVACRAFGLPFLYVRYSGSLPSHSFISSLLFCISFSSLRNNGVMLYFFASARVWQSPRLIGILHLQSAA